MRILVFVIAFCSLGTAYLEWNANSHLLIRNLNHAQVQALNTSEVKAAFLKLDRIESSKTAFRSQFALINQDFFQTMNLNEPSDLPETLFLQLFDDLEIEAVRTKVHQYKEGTQSWVGQIRSDVHSQVVLTFAKDHFVGHLLLNGVRYKIQPVQRDLYLVSEVDSRKAVNDHHDGVRLPEKFRKNNSVSGEGDVQTQADTFNDGTFVDILMLYTPQAAAEETGIETALTNIIATTNESLARSCVGFRLRLVGFQQVTYAEDLASSLALECMADATDGCLDQIPTLRANAGADIVSLWQSQPIGVAYIPELGESNPAAGFNAQSTYGVLDANTFLHEFGHNMGIGHDRYSDGYTNYQYSNPRGSGFAYVDTTSNLSTNVARGASCYYADLGCYITGYYSNPRITMYGRPLGIPGIADAVKTANFQKSFIADYAQALSGHEPDLTGCRVDAESAKSAPQCFVSTAAFGSPWHPYVESLRQFRDQFLLTHALGRGFVKLYYSYSPSVAGVIEDSELLKAGVRFLLAPILLAVYKPSVALGILTSLFMILFFGVSSLQRFVVVLFGVTLFLVGEGAKAQVATSSLFNTVAVENPAALLSASEKTSLHFESGAGKGDFYQGLLERERYKVSQSQGLATHKRGNLGVQFMVQPKRTLEINETLQYLNADAKSEDSAVGAAVASRILNSLNFGLSYENRKKTIDTANWNEDLFSVGGLVVLPWELYLGLGARMHMATATYEETRSWVEQQAGLGWLHKEGSWQARIEGSLSRSPKVYQAASKDTGPGYQREWQQYRWGLETSYKVGFAEVAVGGDQRFRRWKAFEVDQQNEDEFEEKTYIGLLFLDSTLGLYGGMIRKKNTIYKHTTSLNLNHVGLSYSF